jgi:hypothetical protein
MPEKKTFLGKQRVEWTGKKGRHCEGDVIADLGGAKILVATQNERIFLPRELVRKTTGDYDQHIRFAFSLD